MAVGVVFAAIWRRPQRSTRTTSRPSTRSTATCDTTGHPKINYAGSSTWSRICPVAKCTQVAASPRWLGLQRTVPHVTTHRNRNMVGRVCVTTSDKVVPMMMVGTRVTSQWLSSTTTTWPRRNFSQPIMRKGLSANVDTARSWRNWRIFTSWDWGRSLVHQLLTGGTRLKIKLVVSGNSTVIQWLM